MITALLPILAQALSVTAGDTTEARLRTDTIGNSVDLITSGHVALTLGLRRTSWTLFYSPSVMEYGLGTPYSSLALYNSGGLSLTTALTPRTHLTFDETATYGTQNLRALAVSGAMYSPTSSGTTASGSTTGATSSPTVSSPILPALRDTTIKFGSLTTGAGLTHMLSHSWTFGSFGSYAVIGGLDSASRTLLPRMRTSAGALDLGHAMTPRDSADLTTTASYTQIDPSATAFIQTATAGWTHRLSRPATVSVTGGAAYATSTALDGTKYSSVLPVSAATFTLHMTRGFEGGSLTTSIGAAATPFVDRLTGAVTETLTTAVAVSWAKRRLDISISGFGGTAVSNRGDASMVSGYGTAETVTYALDRRHWSVSAGARQSYQRFTGASETTIIWSEFVALTYTTGREFL